MNAELVTPALWVGALGFTAMAVWQRLAWVRNPRVLAVGGLALASLTLVCHLAGTRGGAALEPRAVVGVLLFGASGFLALRGTRVWTRAGLLLSGGRQRVDDVLASGVTGVEGVFEGRMQSGQAVTSPSGIVCAFYRAEIRAASHPSTRGPLLSVESAHPEALRLCGERGEVRVRFSSSMVVGRSEVRRCLMESPEISEQVLAEGTLPVDALSFEHVGRVGERCRVVGRFERDGARGGQIVGPDGGPALVLLGDGALEAGRSLRRTAAGFLGGAVLACVLSAALLAGGI